MMMEKLVIKIDLLSCFEFVADAIVHTCMFICACAFCWISEAIAVSISSIWAQEVAVEKATIIGVPLAISFQAIILTRRGV